MSLIERLEQTAKQADREIWYTETDFNGRSVCYDLEMADLRDLLQEAAKRIRELESC